MTTRMRRCKYVFLLIGLTACTAGTANNASANKAVASEQRASALSGGFSDDERRLYHAGLQHIYNAHQRLGSFTIAQVIDQEREREQQRAEASQRQRDAAQERAKRAEEARQAAVEAHRRAEEANFIHGDPDCLVLDKRTLGTDSDDTTWYIEGKVTNRCDHELGYVQVEINFYDAGGNQESSGLVNVNNLGSGDTWSFKKPVYETTSSGGKWRIAKISGF